MTWMQVCMWLAAILLALSKRGAYGDYDEDTWVEPNAWGREVASSQQEDAGVCRKCYAIKGDAGHASDNAMALVYYKKFAAALFNREKLQFDEERALYERSLLFRVAPAQLEKLQQLSDPRDLDSILTEILAAARASPPCKDGNEHVGYYREEGVSTAALIWNVLKDLAQLLKSSEIQFVLLAAAVILFGWFIHRRYHVSIIALIVGSILFFGYFHTYLECNRKLEYEQMLEAFEKNEETLIQNEQHWYTPMLSWFRSNPGKASRREKIINASKLNLAFCRPDHVFMLYANDMLLTQFQFVLEKGASTLALLNENLPFPLNYLAPLILLVSLGYVTKLTFKYILSPRAWASLWHSPSAQRGAEYLAPPATSGVAAINEDRISGENLKLLLTAIGSGAAAAAASNQELKRENTAAAALPASGVEDVLERSEAPPPTPLSVSSTPASTKSNSPNASVEALNNNHNVSDRDTDDWSKVTLEDAINDT